jgi:hypothetical protein
MNRDWREIYTTTTFKGRPLFKGRHCGDPGSVRRLFSCPLDIIFSTLNLQYPDLKGVSMGMAQGSAASRACHMVIDVT